MTMIPPEEHKEYLETEWLKPSVVYKKGDSFGSRSLIHDNDKRAGSAICTQGCVLTTMTREEYQKFLLRQHLKKQAKKNMFLKNLPMFQHWPTKWLNKLQDGFIDEVFIRNQPVYNEGDSANDIYLIHSGEFLLTKRVPVKEEHSVQLDKLIGPNQSSLQDQVKPFD